MRDGIALHCIVDVRIWVSEVGSLCSCNVVFFIIDVVDVNEASWQLPCEQREMMEEV